MLKIKHIELSESAAQRLAQLQADVNNSADKPDKADKLWKRKSSSTVSEKAFSEIKETLTKMCVGVQFCNYCEHSEASDIEHILPKSLFPERAFVWENYSLACGDCNTSLKSDLMYVFVPAGAVTTQRVARKTVPPTNDIAFIQPRTENPLDFLELDLDDFTFYEKFPPNTREHEKANKTLEILKLNTIESLKKQRRDAFGSYKRLLAEYVKVSQATTFDSIDEATEGNPALDRNLPFEDEKKRVLSGLTTSIEEHTHPTVLVEMQLQMSELPEAIQKLITTYQSIK